MLTYTGTLKEGNPGFPLLLVDNSDDSTAVFEVGSSLNATAGAGLFILEGLGDYTFHGPISVSGNDDNGLFVAAASNGAFSFTNSVTLNTGVGDALTYNGVSPGAFTATGGLDIDTTSGNGLQADGAGTLTLSGTN